MALSIIKALKDVAQAFKALPKYTPVHVQKTITSSTNMVSTGYSQKIPANSYVCMTATAVWIIVNGFFLTFGGGYSPAWRWSPC